MPAFVRTVCVIADVLLTKPLKVVEPSPVITLLFVRALPSSSPPFNASVLLFSIAAEICPTLAVKSPLFVTVCWVIVFTEAEISFVPPRVKLPVSPVIFALSAIVSTDIAPVFSKSAPIVMLFCLICAVFEAAPDIVNAPLPVIVLLFAPLTNSSAPLFAIPSVEISLSAADIKAAPSEILILFWLIVPLLVVLPEVIFIFPFPVTPDSKLFVPARFKVPLFAISVVLLLKFISVTFKIPPSFVSRAVTKFSIDAFSEPVKFNV